MACAFCVTRKLRCDGGWPTCSTCAKSKRECEYRTLPQRRRPTQSDLRNFEEHLVAYERQTYGALQNPNCDDILAEVDVFAQYMNRNARPESSTVDTTPDESDSAETPFDSSTEDYFCFNDDGEGSVPAFDVADDLELVGTSGCSTLISETVKAQLTDLFFRDVYPNIPIIHKSRYYASLSSAPALQPPLCLRYAMWALAAVQDAQWYHLANNLYEKSRAYLEQDELRSAGTEILNVAHVQCWSLIAAYESYMFLSMRTWSSIRRAAALANVLRMHSLDECDDPTTTHLLPDTQDPAELEERRRTFWSTFSGDRWISSRTGYPMTIIENSITTKLPSSEQSFLSGSTEQTQSLDDALEIGLDPKTSLYGARAVLACILGRVMRHIGTASSFDPARSNDKFWTQHSQLDGLLYKVSSSRSAELRPTGAAADPKIWALDMWLWGLNICLHQTAVDCAKKQDNQVQISQSLRRCREAAGRIIGCIRSIAHIETRKLDPFTASCVYMAATVLFRDHEHGKGRATDIGDLRYLQQVLEIMHKHWKVTEVFITQFKEDLAKSGINLLITPNMERDVPPRVRKFAPPRKRMKNLNYADQHSPVNRKPCGVFPT